jgi:hypothetical protein
MKKIFLLFLLSLSVLAQTVRHTTATQHIGPDKTTVVFYEWTFIDTNAPCAFLYIVPGGFRAYVDADTVQHKTEMQHSPLDTRTFYANEADARAYIAGWCKP